jgi:hypothetical protein
LLFVEQSRFGQIDAIESAGADSTGFPKPAGRERQQVAGRSPRAAWSTVTLPFELTPAEREQWRAALQPVHRESAARFVPDTIDEACRTTGFVALATRVEDAVHAGK